MLGKEFGVKLVVRKRNTEQMEQKNQSFVTFTKNLSRKGNVVGTLYLA